MILTCPECDTKYVVKDGAIPPQGRQVRCASCKHSWHQDPDRAPEEALPEAVAVEPSPPPVQQPEMVAPAMASPFDVRIDEPQIGQDPSDAVEEPAPAAEAMVAPEPFVQQPATEAPAQREEPVQNAPTSVEPEFDDAPVGSFDVVDEEVAPRRRWPMLVGLLLLVVAAAAAFMMFAPNALKARVGLAAAGPSPLQVVLDTRGRQQLASGNEMLTLSGRIINPTEETLSVPPLTAELRDRQSNSVVYRYTFNAGAKSLGPKETTSFNHAEVDVPHGGDDISLTLGG